MIKERAEGQISVKKMRQINGTAKANPVAAKSEQGTPGLGLEVALFPAKILLPSSFGVMNRGEGSQP